MRVLLYGLNYKPELTGIGKYSGELAEWLARAGVDVRVVTAPPYYPQWQIGRSHRNRYAIEDDQGVAVHRCPLYVPSAPRTSTRLAHLASFALSSAPVVLDAARWRPDVLLMVAPTLLCAPAALAAARLAGARAILHIQDYEVDAMFGLGMMRSRAVARLAHSAERFLFRRFDRLSTISGSMLRLAATKGVPNERVMFLPNWIEPDLLQPQDRAYFRERWGIGRDQRVVLYSGNMGKKQGLESVVEAAARLRDRRDLQFVMVGEGAAQPELRAMAERAQLANVRFEPLRPREELGRLLAMADVHLVVQRRGTADVVMPSKLGGILAVGGHALITADSDTELGRLTADHPGIATRVEPESVDALVEGIRQVAAADTARPNAVARAYAERFLDKDAVLTTFLGELRALVAGSGADSGSDRMTRADAVAVEGAS